jgi:NAD(P)-dependent dehydrogenase (short-subunit alcohol dehydrogenase family)
VPTALITGAAGSLGNALARELAERGFTVYAGARDPAAVDTTGGDVRPLRLDVADPASIAAARAELDSLDVLVNNAAIGNDGDHLVLDADFDLIAAALETNTFGPWRLSMAFADLLRESPSGRIVNVSSGAAALSEMGDIGPGYLVSKVALNALTRMLSAALSGDGVLVNSVCPGWVASAMGGEGGRPPSEAARGVAWAATLPDDGPTGGFFRDGEPIAW